MRQKWKTAAFEFAMICLLSVLYVFSVSTFMKPEDTQLQNWECVNRDACFDREVAV